MRCVGKYIFVLSAFLVFLAQNTEEERILAVLNVGVKSHWNFMRAVLNPLADRGHHVTVFTPFKDDNRSNFETIHLPKIQKAIVRQNFVEIIRIVGSTAIVVPLLINVSRTNCDLTYEHEKMKQILSAGPNSGYDVLIVEPYASECVNLIATELKIPMIYVIPTTSISHMEWSYTGNAPNPAYSGHLISSSSHPSKYFYRRFFNTILFAYVGIQRLCYERTIQFLNPEQYRDEKSVKPSIIFQNTHIITEPSRPFAQNLVQIGGIHLNPPETIPKDILQFIDESPHGVIYFTFGSLVFMSSLPDTVQKTFKEVLSQVPQRILWKYEGVMTDKPDNVMTREWFPQRDILMHPKVKLFISHGGISGVYEAVAAGVPVLGFPLFYDQPMNVQNLVEAGMAKSMDLFTISKNSFYDTVTELLNNKSYSENAKSVSRKFNDRQSTPSESVVYWTEYVIRHKGAPHLISNAIDLTGYQYLLLDIIFAVVIGLFISYYVSKKILRTIYILFFANSKSNAKK